MIERATGQGRTIITICNYDKYQDIGEESGQATGQDTGQRPDSDRTTKEQGNHGTIVDEEANASPSTARGARKPAKRKSPFILPDRSEEHTSELQSLMRQSYAVFCLKKKKTEIKKKKMHKYIKQKKNKNKNQSQEITKIE